MGFLFLLTLEYVHMEWHNLCGLLYVTVYPVSKDNIPSDHGPREKPVFLRKSGIFSFEKENFTVKSIYYIALIN